MRQQIILLDLNYTLVKNSQKKITPFTDQIKAEEYDEKLVEKLQDKVVFLITARPEKHREQTLASILEKTGGGPVKAFFNHLNLPPPQIKERVLVDLIFPDYPQEKFEFVAIESNPLTRTMYARYGIQSMTKSQFLMEE